MAHFGLSLTVIPTLCPLTEWLSNDQPGDMFGATTLPDRIDYAILAILFQTPDEEYQASWHEWEVRIKEIVPDYTDPSDLLAGLKRMWNGSMLQMVDPDQRAFSGDDADDETFFFTGPFKAVATIAGGACWDGWLYRQQFKAASSR